MASHSNFRRQSRKMALCGMMTALSAAVLSTGSLIPFATFAGPMLAMLCLLPILHDWGAKYALMVYAAAAVLALMLCADKELALFYAFLGWYPAVRPRLAPLPRPVRILLKCAMFTLAMAVMYLLIIFLFQMEAVAEEFAGYSTLMLALLVVLGNTSFLLLDVLLLRMSVLYARWRK
ncbi:MAG: hypothetical protein HFF73_02045 [Oscillospiraceae bacterium]|nr:hypothetical protein [Oscillospiraceae bacterium]